MSASFDALVVGSGLAGAAAAFGLARGGRDVVLLEREAGPGDKVCGEFLSFEALHYLSLMGIDPERLGAPRIRTVGFAAGRSFVARPLPFRAFSLSRRVLDAALLERAGEAGATVRRGAAVKSVERRGPFFEARCEDGTIVSAREAFLATGKHDLKGWRRPPGRQNDLIGFKRHLRLPPDQANALDGRVELFVFKGGYGGLQPVEDGRANLCLLVDKSRFAALGGGWPALLASIERECEHLRRRLAGAEPVHDRPLAIFAIPYGFVRRPGSGAWHLGDQAGVIPSFSGEGMSMALHSGHLAARYCLAGRTADAFQVRLASDISRQIETATLLSRLVLAPPTAMLLSGGLRLAPSLMALVARATRLSPRALGEAGASVELAGPVR